ncbi:DUF6255 family natural product biosynthesis protein [Streptomyces syringium]|uniref:DUF6255 family natural product biosynthesis protein n=1 Tax=Streptomyces syringium TaxID=76729 RepID=UPI0036AB1525
MRADQGRAAGCRGTWRQVGDDRRRRAHGAPPTRGPPVTRVVGRVVSACSHHAEWTRTADKATCKRCGVERYSSYRLLRMPVEQSFLPRRQR